VNDCRALIRRDLRSACPVICEGDTELRFQSCRSCAEEAEKQGEPALARLWRAASCAKGDPWSCGEAAPGVAITSLGVTPDRSDDAAP
jgi:hypothetical protein